MKPILGALFFLCVFCKLSYELGKERQRVKTGDFIRRVEKDGLEQQVLWLLKLSDHMK